MLAVEASGCLWVESLELGAIDRLKVRLGNRDA